VAVCTIRELTSAWCWRLWIQNNLHGVFKRPSVYRGRMSTRLSWELENVEAVQKESGTPPHLHCWLHLSSMKSSPRCLISVQSHWVEQGNLTITEERLEIRCPFYHYQLCWIRTQNFRSAHKLRILTTMAA